MSDIAQDIMDRQARLAEARANWETLWQEVAERILPSAAQFGGVKTPGGNDAAAIFDSTAPLALERFSAALESVLTPRTQRWHNLKPKNPDLGTDQEVMRWCQFLTERMFSLRYASGANFASQFHEAYLSLGAYGTGGVYISDDVGRAIRYKSIFLGELFLAENAHGGIDTVFRRFRMTPRQAVAEYGEDNVPDQIAAAYRDGKYDQRFEFIHAVLPAEETGEKLAPGMRWASYHVSVTGRKLLKVGGYFSFPYAIGRYTTAPNEIYGRGPAITVLADIKSLNKMSKTMLIAGDRAVLPPLLAPHADVLQTFHSEANALNHGAMSDNGVPLVAALDFKSNLPVSLEMQEQKRAVINDAFLVTLFQILVDAPQMTATEALIRAQEKGALLAPTAGRLQTDMLAVTIERELDIMTRAGLIPPPPEQLLDSEGGVALEVEYDSYLSRAQRADEGVAIMKTLEVAPMLAQLDPSVVKMFKGPEILRQLSEVHGMPAKLLRDDDELAALLEQEQQAQAAMMAAQAAPAVAGAAKDMAQAGLAQEQAAQVAQGV